MSRDSHQVCQPANRERFPIARGGQHFDRAAPMAWAWFWLVCLLPLVGPAAPASLRFAWLSDTHIGSSTAEADLRASVRDINSLEGISFVVASGDVTEYGSLSQLQLAKEVLGELRVPCYVIPGNHDTKWSESGATDFPRLWKADRFVFEAGGYRFIGMHQGPLMKMGDGHWAPQDVRWLETTLAGMKDPDQPIIFITHYPIDDGIANWYVVLDRLKQHNTQAVLCGHGHANRAYEFEGVPGIMGRSNLRARQEIGGYNLVEIRDGLLTCSERLPGKETRPAWHSVPLKKHAYASDTKVYPRPDFSVNAHYPAVRERWAFGTGYTIASTPGVYSGPAPIRALTASSAALPGTSATAIVGDASGTVYGLALETGNVRWKFKTQNAVYATPASAGDLAVIASTDGRIYALEAATGKKQWQFKSPRPIVASPAVADGTVYCGSSEGKFRALDLKSGRLAWSFDQVNGFVETRPLLHDGKVIFGAWDQHLYALDARTGRLVWKWKGDRPGTLLSPAACWPVAARGKVFVVAPDRRMTALDAATGTQVWRTGDYVVRESIGIAEDQQRIFLRAMNDFFYAFNTEAAEPEKVWELNAHFGYDINSAMLAEKGGTVFFGTKNGLLFALDSRTGALQWQHKIGVGIVNTVVPLSATQLLATDFDGKIVLIDAEFRARQPGLSR